jgi:hypothetical protein
MSRVSLWPVLRTTNFLCSVDAFYARSLKHRVGIRPDVFHDVIFAIVNLPFCFEPKVLVLPFGTTRRFPQAVSSIPYFVLSILKCHWFLLLRMRLTEIDKNCSSRGLIVRDQTELRLPGALTECTIFSPSKRLR